MARARSSDSGSSAMVVTLVICILIILILGVTTFLGFSGKADLTKEKDEQTDLVKKRTEERDKWEFEARARRAMMEPANNEDLLFIQGKKSANKADLDRIARSAKSIPWDTNKDKPDKTYEEVMADMQNKVKTAEDQLADANNKLAEAKKLQGDAEDLARKAGTDYKTNLDNLTAQFQKLQGTKGKEFTDALTALQDRDTKIRNLTDQAAKDKENNENVVAKLQETIKALEDKMRKIQAETGTADGVTKQVDLLKFDQPKGKIVRIERSATTVYINLGSAERVKPQLTFTVFGAGRDGRAEGEVKGTIEVIDVLGDHLSRAKVTEVAAPVLRPFVTGDLLYNIAWSPGMREHVAIAGFIDLTGDGKDGTKTFKEQLEAQGIIVDAYLDLQDLTFKGKGMTQNTSYLVIGETPDVDANFQVEGAPARMERAQDMLVKVSEIRNEANKLGVTVIPIRRFMALIGYRPPRNAFTADKSSIASPYLRSIKPIDKPAEKPIEKPADKPGDQGAPPKP